VSAELLQALRAQAESAREFRHTIGARPFVLRVPTEYDWRRLMSEDRDSPALVQRNLLAHAVVGWEGLVVADVFPLEGGADPLEFSPDARECWLDHCLADGDALSIVLIQRYNDRRARIEATRKN